MPESRWINTGGGAYTERGTITRNANRRHYGDPTPGERPARCTPAGAQVFAAARRHIDAIDAIDAADAADPGALREPVARIEAETGRGDAADPALIVDALRTLSDLAPELAATIAAGLVDPSAGVAPVVRSAAARALGPPG